MTAASAATGLDLGPPVHTYEGRRCSQHAWLPLPGLLYVRQDGHLDEELARDLIRLGERAIAAGPGACAFVDALTVTGYTPEHRAAMTGWLRSSLDRIEGMHVLTRSRLVAMGISVANLALSGRIRAYATRAPFDEELSRALAGGARRAVR